MVEYIYHHPNPFSEIIKGPKDIGFRRSTFICFSYILEARLPNRIYLDSKGNFDNFPPTAEAGFVKRVWCTELRSAGMF